MEILGLIIEVELKQLTQFAIWNEGNISGHTDYVCVFIAFTIIYVITLIILGIHAMQYIEHLHQHNKYIFVAIHVVTG